MVEPYQDYSAPLRRLTPRRTKTGASSTSLKGVNTFDLPDGSLCVVTSTHEDYMLFRESTDAPDGDLIIEPSAGPGRWFKQAAGDVTSVTSSIPALLTVTPPVGDVILTPTEKIVDESTALSTSSVIGLWVAKASIQIPAVDGTFLLTGIALCSSDLENNSDVALRLENVTDTTVLGVRFARFASSDVLNVMSLAPRLIFTNTAAAGAKDIELQFSLIQSGAAATVSVSDATLVAERLT